MKLLSLSLFFILLVNFCHGQNASLTNLSTNFTSNPYLCDSIHIAISPDSATITNASDLNLFFTGSNLLNQSYTLDIEWSNGNITTHTGTATSTNTPIVWSPSLDFAVSDTGYTSINLELVENSSNDSLFLTYYYYGHACEQMTFSSYWDCDGDGIMDSTAWLNSVFLVSGIDTLHASVINNNTDTTIVYFPSLLPGSYSVGVNQFESWNYWWNTPPVIHPIEYMSPSTITMPATGPIHVDLIVECAFQSCFTAVAFCDDNGNGVYDSLSESPIINMPLENSQTDASGYVNIQLGGYSTVNSGYLNLPYNWMNSNGYGTNNQSYFYIVDSTYLDSNCNSSNVFNIPLICTTYILDSICITGQLFCDANNNGILDTNESVIPKAPVQISDANIGFTSIILTDSSGYYYYHNYHPNTDSVEVIVSSWWLINNGYSTMAPITVSTLDCSINTDIALDCNIALPCDNTWINMSSAGPYYQNWTNTMALSFGNSDYLFPGSVYTISIIIPSGSSLDTASFSIPGYSLNGDTLSWMQTINGFDSLNIDFNISAAIPDSTLHPYQVSITGPNLDCDSINNSMTYTAVVGASFDPNNKLVNLPEYINPAVQDVLYYTINFQNTGTAPAQDVFIEDQLSPYLDWSTFEVISKSHSMHYSLDATGKLVFTFPQIWLPDSTTNEPLSKGYVTFKIKESANIQLNETIENTAYIYFDFNAPIVTNTTRNTNIEFGLGLSDFKEFSPILVYPNPSKGVFNIQSAVNIKAVQVFNVAGNLLFSSINNNNLNQIDVSAYQSGTYIIHVRTDSGVRYAKIIIE